MLLTQGDLIPVEPEATSIPWTRRKSQILNFLHRGPVDFSTLVYDTNVGDISAISTYFNPDRVSVQDLNSKFGQYPSSNPEKDEKSDPGDVMKPRLLLYPEHNQNQMKAQRTLKWVLSHQEVTSQTASLYDNWQQNSGWQQLNKNGSREQQLNSRKADSSLTPSGQEQPQSRQHPDSIRQLQPSPDDGDKMRKLDSWQMESSRSLHSSTDSLSSAGLKRSSRCSTGVDNPRQSISPTDSRPASGMHISPTDSRPVSGMHISPTDSRPPSSMHISTTDSRPPSSMHQQYLQQNCQSRYQAPTSEQTPIGYPVYGCVGTENYMYQQTPDNYRSWDNQNIYQHQHLWN